MTQRLERITPSGTIWFPEWFDLFAVDPPTTVKCPDCEEESPVLENVYALAKWAAEHELRCEA